MITPFINFAGQAAEAIAFYETAFEIKDKKVQLYKDMPADLKSKFPKETDSFVLHAEMTMNGTQVWIGDSSQGITSGDMVSLAVPFSKKDDVQKAYDKLKVGGKILMELAPTFYSPLFGVVKDKFGVVWHLICLQA